MPFIFALLLTATAKRSIKIANHTRKTSRYSFFIFKVQIKVWQHLRLNKAFSAAKNSKKIRSLLKTTLGKKKTSPFIILLNFGNTTVVILKSCASNRRGLAPFVCFLLGPGPCLGYPLPPQLGLSERQYRRSGFPLGLIMCCKAWLYLWLCPLSHSLCPLI